MAYGCENCGKAYYSSGIAIEDGAIVSITYAVPSCDYCDGRTEMQLLLEIKDLLKEISR